MSTPFEIAYKLTHEQRQQVNELFEAVIDSPEDAAHAIVALRAENTRLREALERIATYVPKGSSADIIARSALAEGKGEGR